MSPTLWFATEASRASGLGHFMRCYALAEEAAAQGLASRFFMPEVPESVQQRLQALGASAQATGDALASVCLDQRLAPGDWWVADSYRFDADFLQRLHRAASLLVWDDLCALPRYDCDLIVNASPVAAALPYAERSRARLLLGPAHSAVRREFRQARATGPGDGTLPVTLMIGGSDPRGLSLALATGLRQHFAGLPLRLVLGPAFADPEGASARAMQLGGVSVHRQPPDLARLLADSALVITAAGGSIGELCALGQVAVALVVVDNQAAALSDCPYPALDARQALPWRELVHTVNRALTDAPWRQQLATRAHALVDGRGCARILEALQST